VEYHDEVYNVLLSGKKVMLQHTKTGKKVQIWHKDINKVKKIE